MTAPTTVCLLPVRAMHSGSRAAGLSTILTTFHVPAPLSLRLALLSCCMLALCLIACPQGPLKPNPSLSRCRQTHHLPTPCSPLCDCLRIVCSLHSSLLHHWFSLSCTLALPHSSSHLHSTSFIAAAPALPTAPASCWGHNVSYHVGRLRHTRWAAYGHCTKRWRGSNARQFTGHWRPGGTGNQG